MRVSRQQAAKNRDRVIETASRLFREHGFDGIGLKDLMAAAGLTQGGFYKQFASKDELVGLAAGRALSNASTRWAMAAVAHPEDPITAMTEIYLSRGHSMERGEGCAIVALGSDAARQGPEVKAAFEAGIRRHIDLLSTWLGEDKSDEAIVMLSTLIGAVLLSRIVNDEALSQRILEAVAANVRDRSADTAEGAEQAQ
jgi:TetR/AcrR family transcriptional repressor of nem operon